MAHNWWHIWGEVGERSNRTLDTGQIKSTFNSVVPEGKRGTETLDAIGNWFNNTAYGKRFKAGQEREAALQKTLIDQGGPYALYAKIKNQPNELEQNILQGISDKTGWDRRITDTATHVGLSLLAGGTARGISNVARSPKAMQGLKNINPLAPASQKVVKVKATRGNQLKANYDPNFSPSVRFSKKDLEAMGIGKPMAYTGTGKRVADPYIYQEGAKKITEGVSDGLALKKNFSKDLLKIYNNQVKKGIKEHSRGDALREFKNFRTNTSIQTTKGASKRIDGITSAVKLIEKGEKDLTKIAKKLSFSPTGKTESDADRILRETPPVDELKAYLKVQHGLNPSQIDEVIKLHSKHARAGFGRIREVARQRSLSRKDWTTEYVTGQKIAKDDRLPGGIPEDAGHLISAKSQLIHPDTEKYRTLLKKEGVELKRLAQPATSTLTGRSEERKANIQGSNRPEHELNVHLAKLIGAPSNWAEDIDFVVDKYLGNNRLQSWKERMNSKQMEKAFELKHDATPKEALEFFKKEIQPLSTTDNLRQYSTFEAWEQSFAPRKLWLTTA